jgi:hypothetical protein
MEHDPVFLFIFEQCAFTPESCLLTSGGALPVSFGMQIG